MQQHQNHPPVTGEMLTTIKQEIVTNENMVVPLKKSKLDYVLPYNALDTLCLPIFTGVGSYLPSNNQRHPNSAFGPFGCSPKELKVRQSIAAQNQNQNNQRTTLLETSVIGVKDYHPNVALKKHRLIKQHFEMERLKRMQKDDNERLTTNEVSSTSLRSNQNNHNREEDKIVVKMEVKDEDCNRLIMHQHQHQHQKHENMKYENMKHEKSPDSQQHNHNHNNIDSTVSVLVQSTTSGSSGLLLSRYNSEIELSTDDTDDTASISSDKCSDLIKLEEVLKSVSLETREIVLKLVRGMNKDHQYTLNETNRIKDERIRVLESRVEELKTQVQILEDVVVNTNNTNNSNHSNQEMKDPIDGQHHQNFETASAPPSPPPSSSSQSPNLINGQERLSSPSSIASNSTPPPLSSIDQQTTIESTPPTLIPPPPQPPPIINNVVVVEDKEEQEKSCLKKNDDLHRSVIESPPPASLTPSTSLTSLTPLTSSLPPQHESEAIILGKLTTANTSTTILSAPAKLMATAE